MDVQRVFAGRQRARAVLAVALVSFALLAAGLPATAAQQSSSPTTSPAPAPAPAPDLPKPPDQPPIAPPAPPPDSAAPARPFPFGPVPALPKAGDELVDRRTERSKTFATDKVNQFRTELYSERVHYRDAKGAYQEIDSALGETSNGVRKNKANAFVLELAEDANAGAVARLHLDETGRSRPGRRWRR
jgi:hypothetical protein